MAAGRLADALGLDAFSSATIRRTRLKPGCILARSPFRPRKFASAQSSSARATGHQSSPLGWRPILTTYLVAAPSWARSRLERDGEFAQLGLPFPSVPERQAALAESIEIIRGVWGTEPFSYHGEYHTTERERVVPPPVQQPSPPLILAGGGERTALRLVARYADACNFGPGHATGLVRTADAVRHKNAVLDRHCREVGRDPRSVLRTHFTSWLMLAPTRTARAKLDHYYPEGINEEQQFSRVVGTPAQVAAYYQTVVDAGMEYFVVQTLDAADTRRSNCWPPR